MANPTLRLHLLAINAKAPLEVTVDGARHQLQAGDPAVVHELELAPGVHELTFAGRVPTGATGKAAAEVELPEDGIVDAHYALPAVRGMRGEVLSEPDGVPGREWRRVIFLVLALTIATWAVSLAWLFIPHQ